MTRLLTAYPGIALALLFALVCVLLFVVGRLHRVLPRESRLERLSLRFSGAAQAVIVLWGLLWAVPLTYPLDPVISRWLTVAVFLTALWSIRNPLTNWIDGMILRGEGTLQAGDRIGFDAGQGRILRLGLRSAEVEAEDGRLLRLPYTALMRGAIEVHPKPTATRSHSFSVVTPHPTDAGEQMRRMVSAAVLSPWSSAAPAPSVRLLDQQEDGARFEVTVYPVSVADASKVEKAVRQTASTPT